jgi:hypothetical protein
METKSSRGTQTVIIMLVSTLVICILYICTLTRPANADSAKSGACSASVAAAKGAKTTTPKRQKTSRPVTAGDITYFGERDPISMNHGKPLAHLEMGSTMAATVLPDTSDVADFKAPTKHEKGEPFSITTTAGE